MKLTPKPVSFSDSEKVDKSRDIVGLSKWAQSSRTVSFIMFVLGWLTIPVEVFLRRDFGQRWFTAVNFYAGLFVLMIFATVQYLIAAIWYHLATWVEQLFNAYYVPQEPSFADQMMDSSMLLLLILYVMMGSYQRFKIRWRNQTNNALHSYDDGTSRLERVAGILMKLVNFFAVPLTRFYIMLIPKRQKATKQKVRLVNDRTAFANTVLEPFLLLFLAVKLHGIISLWLFVSAIALVIHANWKEMAKQNKILDFRDSMIEAKMMMELKNELMTSGVSNPIIQQAAETIKSTPEIVPQISHEYPDLMNIIEKMNNDRMGT